ncbi:efflux transporter outer membrane subunit [Campylobacter geochelonis]|uniref:RND efflux system, outer membrane lipoprotein CmeC n=1 Tax=Campylobacter geochelonis TaxID=1780362 RepID=A0A128EBX0_9BACT|nr:TolC family protein [Campylobacter geochelonis]QKF70510.1 multidrug efflux system CmeABC, outer membrane lipoprotein CmeC [Campylobacter geochelonis]CZE46139.1 RND efflux system%2C outer membrane lipoprotein CmeC [Campylobacter geochelonis]CZE46494.1 RND efflux system%2C outer membrane lipoprotein CmeC [Campylobacter geochelonis]
MRVNKRVLSAVLLAFVFAGCSFKPATPLKDTTYKATYQTTNLNDMWWKDFNDTALNKLVSDGLSYNSDLALALNNIELARVNLGLSKLDYLPNVGYQGSATRANNTPLAPDLNSQASYNIGLNLNYELDLWGRVRNGVEAKKSMYMASKYDYNAARLSIASSIASTYFRLLFLKEQEGILKDTLASYENTLEFRQNQLNAGVIGSITYHQAQAQVDSAKSQLVNVQNQLSSTNTALAILTGKSYDEILYKDILTNKNSISNIPDVPSGVPSDLLLHRADVASALEKLKATNFLVGVARANYFPKISLTGLFGYASLEFDRLITQTSSNWSAGGSLVGPLLDFGRTARGVEIANLEQNASFINYDKTLKNAFGEVRNALVSRENSITKQNSMKNLVNSSQKVYDLANQRYSAGYSDHLELLDAQRQLLSSKLSLASADFDVANSVVEVYKALGGGFNLDDNATKELISSDKTVLPTTSVSPFAD